MSIVYDCLTFGHCAPRCSDPLCPFFEMGGVRVPRPMQRACESIAKFVSHYLLIGLVYFIHLHIVLFYWYSF